MLSAAKSELEEKTNEKNKEKNVLSELSKNSHS